MSLKRPASAAAPQLLGLFSGLLIACAAVLAWFALHSQPETERLLAAGLMLWLCCVICWLQRFRSAANQPAQPSLTSRNVSQPFSEEILMSPRRENGPLCYTISSEEEEMVEATLMRLWKRVDDAKPPAEREELVAAGWRDKSHQTARLFLTFPQNPKRAIVSCQVRTHDQVTSFPTVALTEGRNGEQKVFSGGAIPIFFSMGHWPSWFPFCKSATLLKRFSSTREIWLLRFKIALITVDSVLFVVLEDNLVEKGTVDVVMESPAEGMEGQEWMGIQVPAFTATVRSCTASMRLSLKPTSSEHGELTLQCEMIDAIGIEWITVLFWKTCSTRVLPLIMKEQEKWVGSTLQQHLDGDNEGAKEMRLNYIALHESISAFLYS